MTKPDRRNFFPIARGLARESVSLIEIARRRALVEEDTALALRERPEVIVKMISGLIKSAS